MARSVSGLGLGTHDFKTGIQMANATQRTVSARIGGVSYTDLSGALYRATCNEPSATGGRVRSVGASLQDTWSLNDVVTLNLGVWMDRVRGGVPAMTSAAVIEGIRGATTFEPPVVSYPGVGDLVSFNTFSPRLGFTVRLDKSGRTGQPVGAAWHGQDGDVALPPTSGRSGPPVAAAGNVFSTPAAAWFSAATGRRPRSIRRAGCSRWPWRRRAKASRTAA